MIDILAGICCLALTKRFYLQERALITLIDTFKTGLKKLGKVFFAEIKLAKAGKNLN